MPDGASLQDFTFINDAVKKIKNEHEFKDLPSSFIYYCLDTILKLQDDEVLESITDTNFLKNMGIITGHDRGIDAIYIDEEHKTIHIFNCKYTEKFARVANHFPSSDTDKIILFLNGLITRNNNLLFSGNSHLKSKVEEIWDMFDKESPNFKLHLCCNYINGLEAEAKQRFEAEINRYSNFKINYNLLGDFVKLSTKRNNISINSKIRVEGFDYIKKDDGDVRALIITIPVLDLIRIVLDNEDIRNKVNDYEPSSLANFKLAEDAFEDNVRVYLRQRSRINKNIVMTLLGDNNNRFFYFNNGITITCERYTLPEFRSPVITLENLQIVNGGQTVHAIYDVLKEAPSKLARLDILCRIYETRNHELSSSIAQYTNSQNPVNNRDIRSIDYVQQKLESQFLLQGFFYERKRNQYLDKPKDKRIDAEKVGQVLLSFYSEMPAEAKNRKSIIFGEKYDELFNDEITADKVLLPYNLYKKIEDKKYTILNNENSIIEDLLFLSHSTYYMLYTFKKLSEHKSIGLKVEEEQTIWNLYDSITKIFKEIIDKEKKTEKPERFSEAVFFKSNKPKKRIEELIKNKEIDKYL